MNHTSLFFLGQLNLSLNQGKEECSLVDAGGVLGNPLRQL